VCTLAHVLEAAGLATVVLVALRPVAERLRPPRALYGEFPLGRPLGKPGDPGFQRDVLSRAFALLESPGGPVLENHPEVIVADETPLACTLPARYDPDHPPAVEEARGLRAAYDRSRSVHARTSVGRVVDADGVPNALRVPDAIAAGAPWAEAGIPRQNTTATVHDIRAYYEEAALALVDGPPPGGRQAERWFYESTQAGRTVLAAQQAMRETGAPFAVWFYMGPGHR
jgi:D-proline reductase (dithiol) PrdB